jgi:hypothetical protein
MGERVGFEVITSVRHNAMKSIESQTNIARVFTVLLGLFFDHEVGGDMFLRNVS